ncbi:MAG TPA: hypothetical protein PKD86_17750 [Gemmatales bacterium]|nr:hypothetical protein [Gemmatales bacterium]
MLLAGTMTPSIRINEANLAVKKAIKNFTGQTCNEFLAHLRQTVLERLETSGI